MNNLPGDVRNSLAVMLSVLLLAAGAWLARRTDPRITVTRRTHSVAGGEVPLLVFEPALAEPRATALLTHGVTSSKESMVGIGEALALRGVRCVAYDAPGHGGSPMRLGDRAARLTSARVAVNALIGDKLAPRRASVGIGHSMGTALLAEVMKAEELELEALVALGARPPRDLPAGLRVALVTGASDGLATPASLERLAARLREDGHAAEVVAVPGVDHILEPWHSASIQASVDAALAGIPKTSLDPDAAQAARAAQRLRWLGAGLCLLAGAALWLLGRSSLTSADKAPTAADRTHDTAHNTADSATATSSEASVGETGPLTSEPERPGRLRGFAIGAGFGLLVLVVVEAALGGSFVRIWPTLSRLPFVIAVWALVGFGSFLATAILNQLPVQTKVGPATLGLAIGAVAFAAATGGLAWQGAAFPALLAGILTGVQSVAAALGATLERRLSSEAVQGFAAIALGTLPGSWLSLFL